jgi:hypothetical protein
MTRPRVLYYLSEYPMTSQTYIKTEIEALLPDYDIAVITRRAAPQQYRNHLPYEVVRDNDHAHELAEEFRPHVLHTQWLYMVPEVARLSRQLGVPFTVRSHSFDTLWGGTRGRWFDRSPIAFRFLQAPVFAHAIPPIRDDACLGVLAFPFVVPRFRKAGVPGPKIRASYPVVAVKRFLDRSPNGSGVIAMGAARPKKEFTDFLEVAAGVPSREFTLYPMGAEGSLVQALAALNEQMGSPATIPAIVQPEDVPKELKRSE